MTEIHDPRPAYFADPNLDRLMTVVLDLALEIWVAKDRQYVVELLLARRGLLPAGAIDAEPVGDGRAFLEQLYAAR